MWSFCSSHLRFLFSMIPIILMFFGGISRCFMHVEISLFWVYSADLACYLLRRCVNPRPVFFHLKYIFFCLPSCPCPAFSTCPSPSDGIIHVILSIYKSSDTNGCTANPAAGKSGRMPKLGVPSKATAAPALSGAHDLLGSTNAQQSGRRWQDCKR